MLFPFPDRAAVEVAAVAVLKEMRATPHLYDHSLRYLPTKAQFNIARRIARAAAFALWQAGGEDALEAIAHQVAERAQELIAEVTVAPEPKRSRRPIESEDGDHPPVRTPPWHRKYDELASYLHLKAKYSPEK